MFFLWFSAVLFLISSNLATDVQLLPESLPLSLSGLVPANVIPRIFGHDKKFYYLPNSEKKTKLFDEFDPDLISFIMTTNGGIYRDFFVIPIFKDYIIPYFLTGSLPHAQDLEIIRTLPFINEVLKNPIEQLRWALYFATGSTCARQKDISVITGKFSKLDFKWRSLCRADSNCNWFRNLRAQRLNNMLPIYITAILFGIEISQIAHYTKDVCGLSREIDEDRIPEMLNISVASDSLWIFFAFFDYIAVPLQALEHPSAPTPFPAHMVPTMSIDHTEEDAYPPSMLIHDTETDSFAETCQQPLYTLANLVPQEPIFALIANDKELEDIQAHHQAQYPDSIVNMICYPVKSGEIQRSIDRSAMIQHSPATIPQGAMAIDEMLPLVIRNHIFLNEEGQFVYLPPQDGVKLFDRIDRAAVSAIMEACESRHPHLFSIAIIRDYILPVLHDHRTLPVTLSNLPNIYECLRPMFRCLLWTLYFAEGETRRNKTQTVNRYRQFLQRFGLEWGKLRPGCVFKSKSFDHGRKKQIKNLPTIYLWAKYWKIDMSAIAERTASEYWLSQAFKDGNWPKQLLDARLPSSVELFICIVGTLPVRCPLPMQLIGQSGKRSRAVVEEDPNKRRRLIDCPDETFDRTQQPVVVDPPTPLPDRMDPADEPVSNSIPVPFSDILEMMLLE